MTASDTIFQRTHAGREEIHNKSHGLTQSERLVLIMVDGVATCKEIRGKLPALTDERFARALQKLQAKELVVEVFMPMEWLAPDELERTVVDRFLQQDPMDPVTVMLQDPEDELGLLDKARHDVSQWAPVVEAVAPLAVVQAVPSRPVVVEREDFPTLIETAPPARAESPLAAEDVQAADDLMAELRAKRAQRPPPPVPQPVVAPREPIAHEDDRERSPFAAVHWGYWLIVAGLSFILGFFLARITS